MDRSYLSASEVIEASRSFVCVRLVTFEDVEEMKFMNSIYDFRTPTKNSLFAILDPSAKEHLVKPGRSMEFTFDDAAQMAAKMEEIAKSYPGPDDVDPAKLGMPYLKDVRLALNVAACDTQSLIILYAPKVKDHRKLESLLLPLAWHKDLMGEFLFVATDKLADLAKISETGIAPGLLVVTPGTYGLEGRQVAFVPLSAKASDAHAILVAAAEANRLGSKDSKRHIGRGRREGVKWEPVLEDPGPVRNRRSRQESYGSDTD
ncbi:MAG: hypothetical protein COA70_11785 [Planctomycetota bacterium]|nr:MAG: hypothetical protein COA70_11785 [Planctomycetota bacterium]